MAHQPGGGGEYGQYGVPNVQDLDVTVLAFAQWLSEMRSRSNSSLQQMLAEMGIIRNGITSNNTDLTDFKRNTATVQQQMQSQISDLRDKLSDAYTEIANLKKMRSGFEQEVHAQNQSLWEQMQVKTLELESLKKAYAGETQRLQQQLVSVQSEVHEIRLKGDDHSRQSHLTYEQHINKTSEVELAAQYANNEMKRLRSDHDQAIANLAENMNRWNDTLRDLSKEFHDFQKVMNVNHQRIQSNLWEVQAKGGMAPLGAAGSGAALDAARMESGGDLARSPAGARASAAGGAIATQAMMQGAQLRAQSPSTGAVAGGGPAGAAVAAAAAAAAGQARRVPSQSAAPMVSPYPGQQQQQQQPGMPPQHQPQGSYLMRP